MNLEDATLQVGDHVIHLRIHSADTPDHIDTRVQSIEDFWIPPQSKTLISARYLGPKWPIQDLLFEVMDLTHEHGLVTGPKTLISNTQEVLTI